MEDNRRKQINTLKSVIKEQEKLTKEIFDKIAALDGTEEEKTEERTKLIQEVQNTRKAVMENREALAKIRMNKYGSDFFEWHPNKSNNRSQSRLMNRRMRK